MSPTTHPALFLAVLALAACGGRDTAPTPSPAEVVVYPIRGVVRAVAADRRSVTLDHEAIPGLMEAMEMEFPVSSPAVLDAIEPGARVEGDLQMRGRAPEITRLVRR